MQMTPATKAEEVVASWSEHFMDQSARPTIQMQIEKAILEDRIQIGERIIRMIENEERIGRWSTEIVTDIIRSNYTPVNIGEV